MTSASPRHGVGEVAKLHKRALSLSLGRSSYSSVKHEAAVRQLPTAAADAAAAAAAAAASAAQEEAADDSRGERARAPDSKAARGVPIMELSVSCKNLRKMDHFGLSDPFMVMYVSGGQSGARKIGQTETVSLNLNPYFVRTFDLPYDVPPNTSINCEIYDRDSVSDHVNRHNYLGHTSLRFHELLRERDCLIKPVVDEHAKKPPKVTPESVFRVSRMFVPPPSRQTRWNLRVMLGTSCSPKRGFRMFYELWRSDAPSSVSPRPAFSHVVCRSEIVAREQNFSFNEVTIPVERIQMSERDHFVRMDVLEYSKSGAHELRGSFEMRFKEVVHLSSGKQIPLHNRRSEEVGSATCTKSLRGEDHAGRVCHSDIVIDTLRFE